MRQEKNPTPKSYWECYLFPYLCYRPTKYLSHFMKYYEEVNLMLENKGEKKYPKRITIHKNRSVAFPSYLYYLPGKYLSLNETLRKS